MKQNVLIFLENNNKKENNYNLIKQRLSKNNIKLSSRLSPLRYPGGKSKLLYLIYSSLPKNTEIFIEPFCGGASIGLALLQANVIKKLILNDLDIGIYSLFWTILNDPNYLINKIQKTIPTVELFNEFKDQQKNNYPLMTNKEIAFNYLILNRCSFSGIYNASHLSDLTCRYNPEMLIKKIKLIYDMKDSISLYNKDVINIINEYKNIENCVIYLDPPYYEKGHLLYKHYFKNEDHKRLYNKLEECIENNYLTDYIITYDNVPYIKNLYSHSKNININILDRNYSIVHNN